MEELNKKLTESEQASRVQQQKLKVGQPWDRPVLCLRAPGWRESFSKPLGSTRPEQVLPGGLVAQEPVLGLRNLGFCLQGSLTERFSITANYAFQLKISRHRSG